MLLCFQKTQDNYLSLFYCFAARFVFLTALVKKLFTSISMFVNVRLVLVAA